MLVVVVLFSFASDICFASVKRLAGKIEIEVTYNVLSESSTATTTAAYVLLSICFSDKMSFL